MSATGPLFKATSQYLQGLADGITRLQLVGQGILALARLPAQQKRHRDLRQLAAARHKTGERMLKGTGLERGSGFAWDSAMVSSNANKHTYHASACAGAGAVDGTVLQSRESGYGLAVLSTAA